MKQLQRKQFAWIALVVILSLALPWAAFASDVDVSVVDVTAPVGSVTLAAGQSGSIVINMSVTGAQAGTATFTINRDWTLSGNVFSGSNPQTFTVLTRTGGAPATTFATTGTVYVAPGQAVGSFTLVVGAFDITNSNTTGAKLEAGDASNYQVIVTAPSDTTPPVITPTVNGTLGNNGWYTSDVTVTWTVVDDESTVTSTTGCGATTINYDTDGVTLTCTATSAGGIASESVTIKRDATAPSVYVEPARQPDNGDWYNQPVNFTATVLDDTSGIAGCIPDLVYPYYYDGPDSENASFTLICTDNAGNSGSGSTNFKYDATPPVVTVTPDREPDYNGWYNAPVYFTTAGTDGTSGIDFCDPVQTYSGPDGTNLAVSGSCTDNAGNVGNGTSAVFKYDATAPIINNLVANPNPAAFGSTVTLSVDFLEELSGMQSASYNVNGGAPAAMSGSGANWTATLNLAVGVYTICATGTDQADNTSEASCTLLAVYDPSGGFVTGGGWITSPAGAYAADPSLTGRANFGFVSKYKRGQSVPDGQTQFQFQAGGLNFHSTSYQWLVVAGAKATYKGFGTINGMGNYGFMLTAWDGQVNGGGGIDKFRIKIWDETTSVVVYDNQMNAPDGADPTTALSGGSIVIHNK